MELHEIAWIAGLLEGEGSFYTKTNGFSPQVSCQMTDLDVLERLNNLAGGHLSPVTKRQDHWKNAWVWRISGDLAADLMKQIQPFMGTRRFNKINEVLDIWYTNGRPYRKMNPDIEKAAEAYLRGEGSLRKLGVKYNVVYETLRQRVISLKQTS